MKTLLLSTILLFVTCTMFAQQLPLRIVNNSSQPVQIDFISFYGDAPLFPPDCSNCNNELYTNKFTMTPSQTYLFNEYADFYGTGSVGSPIIGNGCPATIGCSSLAQVETLCGFSGIGGTSAPIWDIMYFRYAPGGIDDDFRLGDPSCGNVTNTNYVSTKSTFTASRTVVGGEILLVFDD